MQQKQIMASTDLLRVVMQYSKLKRSMQVKLNKLMKWHIAAIFMSLQKNATSLRAILVLIPISALKIMPRSLQRVLTMDYQN